MERYLKMWNIQLKSNLLPHIVLTFMLCMCAPAFMGMKNLDTYQTAKIVEVFLSLMGIILFIPVFVPDMNRDIRDLIASKKEPMLTLHLMRIVQSVVCIGVFGIVFLVVLKVENCQFPMGKMLYALFANACFLGGLGVLVFAIFDQIAFAYMVGLIYYILCFGMGEQFLGNFYLFTMQSGSFVEKHYLLVAGILMIVVSLLIRNARGGGCKIQNLLLCQRL